VLSRRASSGSLAIFTAIRRASSRVSNLNVQFSAKLLDKGASRRRVGKAPSKIDLGFGKLLTVGVPNNETVGRDFGSAGRREAAGDHSVFRSVSRVTSRGRRIAIFSYMPC